MWMQSVVSRSVTSVEDMGTLRVSVHQKEKEKERAKPQTEKERQREKAKTKDKGTALAMWCAGHATSLGIGQSIVHRIRGLAMLRRASLLTMLALRRWSYRLEASSG